MKMVIRADDVGYTHVHNLGTFDAVDGGIVTSCDVMLDTPGTVEALEFLKERPWLSVGWHTHFWGSPVLGADAVPSMVDASRGHFRADVAAAADVSYDEALAEMRAQLDRCVKILGRAPDVGGGSRGGSPFRDAMAKVSEEYGLVSGFAYGADFQRILTKKELVYSMEPDPRWADRKIYMTTLVPGTSVFDVFMTDSIAVQRAYDPRKLWLEDETGLNTIPADAIAVVVLHPGYLDHYVCREGDRASGAWQFLLTRPIEAQALCSPEVKRWVRETGTELINFRDALYDTRDYQNHLRQIGSDLCVE